MQMHSVNRNASQDVFTTGLPMGPQYMRLVPYSAPGTLGNKYWEEAAVRLLMQCGRSPERWTLVPYQDLLDQCFEQHRSYYVPLTQDFAIRSLEHPIYERHLRRYKWLQVLTLGRYGRNVARPQLRELRVPDIALASPALVMQAYQQMVDKGLIRVEERGRVQMLEAMPLLIQLVAHPGLWEQYLV